MFLSHPGQIDHSLPLSTEMSPTASLRSNAHRKKSRKTDPKGICLWEGGVNPYDLPDRKPEPTYSKCVCQWLPLFAQEAQRPPTLSLMCVVE